MAFLDIFNIKKRKKTSKRRYEGASKSKRLSRWLTSSTSANSEIALSLSKLRDRSRDLRRNNTYASKAINAISSNVVGHGIKTQFNRPESNMSTNDLAKLWRSWAESTDIDYDGRHDIYGLETLAIEAVAESGEVLIRKRFDSSLEFPLQYQVLESDFIDSTKLDQVLANGNRIIQGIEFDENGKRVAYWLYEDHPGGASAFRFRSSTLSSRVPADQIRHIFRAERPGQARGVPWLSPAIVRLKDLDDFADATVMRQKVAACFSAFVRDMEAGSLDEAEESEMAERLEPGLIEHLPPGKNIEFNNPPAVENYKEYMNTELHGIAAGVGITYEALTGDLSDANFSSARMGWIEFHRNIQKWRKQIMYIQMLDPIVKDFLQIARLLGRNVEGITHKHVAPRREMIDPTKEVPAIIKSIRGGISSLSDEILAQGRDPREHLDNISKDNELLDELGLILDSDARNTTGNGQSRVADRNSGNSEGESSDEDE